MDQCPLRAKLQDVLISRCSTVVVLVLSLPPELPGDDVRSVSQGRTGRSCGRQGQTEISPLDEVVGASAKVKLAQTSRGLTKPSYKGTQICAASSPVLKQTLGAVSRDCSKCSKTEFRSSKSVIWRSNRGARLIQATEDSAWTFQFGHRAWLQSQHRSGRQMSPDTRCLNPSSRMLGIQVTSENPPPPQKETGCRQGQTLPVAPCGNRLQQSTSNSRSNTSTQTESAAPGPIRKSGPDSASQIQWLGCSGSHC